MQYPNQHTNAPSHEPSTSATTDREEVRPAPPLRDPSHHGADSQTHASVHNVEATNEQFADFASESLKKTPVPRSEDDPSRHGASYHAASRTDARTHDNSRQDATQLELARTDTSKDKEINDNRQTEALEEPSENWLDIKQTEEKLRQLGVSRTTRTVQKFCHQGKLTAKLVPTESGSRYIVKESSIEEFVERMQDVLPGNSFAPSETPDLGSHLDHSRQRAESEPSNRGDTAPQLETVIDLKDQHIQMLSAQLDTANRQISVKDDQIAAMLERDHETNVLIQNLQRMIALPEARTSSSASENNSVIEHKR